MGSQQNGSYQLAEIKDTEIGEKRKIKRKNTCWPCNGSQDVDRGYAYVVLFAVFVIFGLVVGQALVINVYFVVFLTVFHQSHMLTAIVGALSGSCMYLFGFFAPPILSRLGARYTIMLGASISSCGLVMTAFANSLWMVYFTYGIVQAIGMCLCFNGSMRALSLYFCDKLRIATGFATCGSGLGLFFMAPMFEYFQDEYGWRGLLLLNAGIIMQMIVCGALMFPKSEEGTGKNRKTDVQIIQTMTFTERITNKIALCLFFVGFLQGTGMFFIYVILKDLLESSRLMDSYSHCMIAVAVGSVIIRIVSGVGTIYLSPLLVHGAIMLVTSLGILLFALPNPTHVLFVALSAIQGLGQGVYTTMPIAISDIFGRAEMAPSYGFFQAFSGFGTMIGPLIGGYIRDTTDSYMGSLLFGGFTVFIGVFVCVALDVYLRRHPIEDNKETLENAIPLR